MSRYTHDETGRELCQYVPCEELATTWILLPNGQTWRCGPHATQLFTAYPDARLLVNGEIQPNPVPGAV